MIKTTDNFISENIEIQKKDIKINKNYYFKYTNKKDLDISIQLKDIKKISLLSFSKKNNDDDLIISIQKNEDNYNIQTGNYIGKIIFNETEIEINSRFSDKFLERMLNFANDIYFDDVEVLGKETKKLDYAKFILYYLFLQKLEKAFLLGLPKEYITIKNHDLKLKGNIDINRFIKNDIPFKGKISSKSREQIPNQYIIDVLYKASSIIKNNKYSISFISNIYSYLKQTKSNQFVNKNIIQKSKQAKALKNPIFTPYKKVLNLAEMIITQNNIENKKATYQTFGFLVNVAELFEVYIYKLLRKEFSDWEVLHEPEISLYKNNFFGRDAKIIPDIVMKKGNKILVFDIKYKKMKFDYSDVDRSDFFQIHTYISYYQNQGNDVNVIGGGLLYPMEIEYNKTKAFSDNFLGNSKTKFFIDGIEIINDEIKEKEFIQRVRDLIG